MPVVLFHFIFELLKISILACVYASLMLFVFRMAARYKPFNWFDKVSAKKLRFWFFSVLIIYVGLFFFMFSYFGDHGLADSARVPIGHWRAIEQSDARQAYIQEGVPGGLLNIDKFMVTQDYVYGVASDNNENHKGRFFVYDLQNNKVRMFEKEKDFIEYLISADMDPVLHYEDFFSFYDSYWNGWRFWLLP